MSERSVVLVTGTSRGIGRELALHLAGRGWTVVGCSRSAASFSHANYDHTICDVTNESQVQSLVSGIDEKHGRLDALVNNAGTASMNHALLVPLASVERTFALNFTGTFLASRAAARVMRKRTFGRIVNLTTVAVPLALEGEAVYAASKGAVETFTRVLAKELAPFGITCNLVGPGPIDTDLLKNVPQDKVEKLLDRLAIKRKGDARDVANVVEFFLREESALVTGQTIYLGGVS